MDADIRDTDVPAVVEAGLFDDAGVAGGVCDGAGAGFDSAAYKGAGTYTDGHDGGHRRTGRLPVFGGAGGAVGVDISCLLYTSRCV